MARTGYSRVAFELRRYGSAVVAAGLATLVRLMLDGLVGFGSRYVTYYLAILIVTWFFGLGPAVVVAVIGAVISTYLLVTPTYTFHLSSPDDIVWFAFYSLVSATIIASIEGLRRQRLRAEVAAALAEQRSVELRREIEQRQHAELAERRQREWAETTLSSIVDAVIATDSRSGVTFMNPAAERLTGWGYAEAAGRPVGEVFRAFRETTREPAGDPLAEILDREPRAAESEGILLVARDGTEWPVDVQAAPIRGESAGVIGAVLVFREVSQRRAAERAIAESHRALSTMNEDLRQFAYAVSHDLREPLRSITGFSELLVRRYADRLDGEASEFLTFVKEGAERMNKLIGDLLVYSRVVHAGMEPETVDSGRAFDRAIENLRVAIDESGAVIRRGELPAVRASEVELTQVFQNLVGNALKYRSDRRPEVEAGAVLQGGEFEFVVRDNGIGIEPEQCGRIFGVFQRLHGDRFDGTGIGLAICKRIVEKYEGRIWVESTPGQGSRFHFTLQKADGVSPETHRAQQTRRPSPPSMWFA